MESPKKSVVPTSGIITPEISFTPLNLFEKKKSGFSLMPPAQETFACNRIAEIFII